MSQPLKTKTGLSVANMELLKHEWHKTKNHVQPHEVALGSGKKYWWVCSKNKEHVWEASPIKRKHGRGCPYCAGRKVSLDNCLATLFPQVAKEWHPTKNKPITPHDVTKASDQTFWWKCKKGHEWYCTVSNRTGGHNCPYCVGIRTSIEDSLGIKNKKLAKEWHPTKNGKLTPFEVRPQASQKVWWLCRKGHDWETPIHSRTRGNGCPHCSSESRTSFGEQAIFYYLSKVFKDVENRYIHKIQNKKVEIDVFIPSLNFGIEYDGCYYHKKRKKKDEEKNQKLHDENIRLVRVREKGLPVLDGDFIQCMEYDYPNVNQLGNIIKDIFSHLKTSYVLPKETIKKMEELEIDIEKERITIYENYLMKEKEKSFIHTYPHLEKEWNYKRNGTLKPEYFPKGSTVKVWWKCAKNHEWERPINHRTRGMGCPFCSGLYPTKENNFLVRYPELAKEWDYTKNELKPNEVTPKSGQLVWWIGKCGHGFDMRVSEKAIGIGCPYCAGKRVNNENCLATIHPHLLKEWDFEKNINISPYEVTKSSNHSVHWKCPNGDDHEWEALISTRTGKNATGCPYCAGKKATKKSNFAILYPEKLKYWDFEKNKGIDPQDYLPRSGKKVWWKCPKGENHEWYGSISNMTIAKGCPCCLNKRLTKENCLETVAPSIAEEFHKTKNNVTPRDVIAKSGKKYWWQCKKDARHEWETTPNKRLGEGTGCPYCAGKRKIK